MVTRSLLPSARLSSAPRRLLDDSPFALLQRETDRLFEEFASSFAWGETPIPPAPRVDAAETITAEVPGIDPKEVEVIVQDDIMTLRGEKKIEQAEESANYALRERSYGAFSRSFRLPVGTNPDQVVATFDKGILRKVPKPLEAQHKVKKIAVKSVA
jgi:HSP20 family protein